MKAHRSRFSTWRLTACAFLIAGTTFPVSHRNEAQRALRAQEAPADASAREDAQAAKAPQPLQPAANRERVQSFDRPYLIRFEGVITPMRAQYLKRSLAKARDANADVVIIEFHSPGGYLEQSLEMGNHLKDIDWARTVAFVRSNEQALSGAAIAALGCDDLVMADNAVFGDAGAIYQAEGAAFRYAPEKLKSDLVRKVRDLASKKGRAPAFAEAMVDMDVEVFRSKDKQTGEIRFLTKAEIDADEDPQRWEIVQLVHESRKEKFLEVNGLRAVELGIAQYNAQGRGQLAERFELSTDITVIEPNAVDTTVYILNLPWITALLFIIGFIALFFELSAPGVTIGGLTSGLCFALFFWSRFLGGTAGWLEVILLVAGLVFIGVELFVIPGFGIAGVAGFLLVFVSLVLASQTFVLPHSQEDWNSLSESLLVMVGSLAAFIVGAFLVVKLTGRIPLVSHFALSPPSAEDAKQGAGIAKGPQETAAGAVQVGDWGVAESALRPSGKAEFAGEFLDVLTEGGYIDKGKQVRVVKIQGNRVVVREVT